MGEREGELLKAEEAGAYASRELSITSRSEIISTRLP